jgi:hypothetical protein
MIHTSKQGRPVCVHRLPPVQVEASNPKKTTAAHKIPASQIYGTGKVSKRQIKNVFPMVNLCFNPLRRMQAALRDIPHFNAADGLINNTV